MDTPGAVSASWARRVSRLDLEVFFLGTAMVLILLVGPAKNRYLLCFLCYAISPGKQVKQLTRITFPT
jgi:hypothetical protein